MCVFFCFFLYKWQSWDSDPTLRDQRPEAALPSFTQGAWCRAPTHGLTGEQQEIFSSSSNCLLVHVLPGEGGVWTLEGWLQSSRPGLAPPDWGCARGRWTGATQPAELSLAGEPLSRSAWCLHVGSEGAKVNGWLQYLCCRKPYTHTHTHQASPLGQTLTAQLGLFLVRQTFRVWKLLWSSKQARGEVVLESRRSEPPFPCL